MPGFFDGLLRGAANAASDYVDRKNDRMTKRAELIDKMDIQKQLLDIKGTYDIEKEKQKQLTKQQAAAIVTDAIKSNNPEDILNNPDLSTQDKSAALTAIEKYQTLTDSNARTAKADAVLKNNGMPTGSTDSLDTPRPQTSKSLDDLLGGDTTASDNSSTPTTDVSAPTLTTTPSSVTTPSVADTSGVTDMNAKVATKATDTPSIDVDALQKEQERLARIYDAKKTKKESTKEEEVQIDNIGTQIRQQYALQAKNNPNSLEAKKYRNELIDRFTKQREAAGHLHELITLATPEIVSNTLQQVDNGRLMARDIDKGIKQSPLIRDIVGDSPAEDLYSGTVGGDIDRASKRSKLIQEAGAATFSLIRDITQDRRFTDMDFVKTGETAMGQLMTKDKEGRTIIDPAVVIESTKPALINTMKLLVKNTRQTESLLKEAGVDVDSLKNN